jgi:peptide/nickel transport system permease protein
VARLLLRRFLTLVPMLIVASFVVYCLMALVPGDPARAIAGIDATPKRIEQVRLLYHLNEPLIVQYGYWLKGAVLLNFGLSSQTHQPVASLLANTWPVTASLVVAAALISLLIGLPLGVLSGIRPGHSADNAFRLFSGLGLAIPNFVLAIVLVILLAVTHKWFPVLGYTPFWQSPLEWARHTVLPALTLGVAVAAVLIRQLRAAMIDVLDSNFVRAAWARGGAPKSVIGKHALKNGAIPVVTVFGISFAALLGGTVIIEQIFSIPGLGQLLLNAIVSHDVPVVQAVTLTFVVTQLIVMLLVDLTYGVLNPKVRVS